MLLRAALPAPNGYVNDFASALDDSAEQYLEGFLETLERDTTAEVVVVTVASLDGMTVEEYANRLFAEWGIGQAADDNGVLLLVAPGDRAVRIEVETPSVSTHHNGRDRHVKGADFLNASEFPTMVFSAPGGKRTGERSFEIAGTLELRGRSQPLTLQATWNKSGPSPIEKSYVMGVSARGSFKRSSYGMNYAVGNGWVGDEVPLIIEFEAKRK